jgi:hypothetical protein
VKQNIHDNASWIEEKSDPVADLRSAMKEMGKLTGPSWPTHFFFPPDIVPVENLEIYLKSKFPKEAA